MTTDWLAWLAPRRGDCACGATEVTLDGKDRCVDCHIIAVSEACR